MQTKSITVYSYADLDDEAKSAARKTFATSTTDYGWWESTYDDFTVLCTYFGISVSAGSINFDLSLGSSFNGTVDIPTFINAIKNESWKEYAPKEDILFPAMSIPPVIAELLDKKELSLSGEIKSRKRGYEVWMEINDNNNHIETSIDWLKEKLSLCAESINNTLFKLLLHEHVYLQTDEAIDDFITENDYWFTITGTYIPLKDLLADQKQIEDNLKTKNDD